MILRTPRVSVLCPFGTLADGRLTAKTQRTQRDRGPQPSQQEEQNEHGGHGEHGEQRRAETVGVLPLCFFSGSSYPRVPVFLSHRGTKKTVVKRKEEVVALRSLCLCGESDIKL